MAALSYVFENAEEKTIVQKAISGYRYIIINTVDQEIFVALNFRKANCVRNIFTYTWRHTNARVAYGL